MTQASSPTIQKAIDWLYGEDAVLHKPMPARVADDLGGKHVNELLGRHPWHPWDPKLPAEHPCHALNAAFGQCMASCPEGMKMHMKHVTCFDPHKTDLMRCLTKAKRDARNAEAAAAGGGVGGNSAESS